MGRRFALLLVPLFLFPLFFVGSSNAGIVDTKILDTGDNYIHGSAYHNGSLWYLTLTNPARILKMNPDTLDYEKVVLDEGLNSGYDIVYAENYMWVILSGPHKLVRVDPNSLAWNVVVTFDNFSEPQSLVYASGQLWVGGYNKIANVSLSDYSYNLTDYSSVVTAQFFHALTNSSDSIWATTDSGGYVLKIDPTDTSNYNSTSIGSYIISDDITYLNNHLFFGTETTQSRIYKVANNLSYEYEQIGTSLCYGVAQNSTSIWAVYASSPGVVRQISQTLTVQDTYSFPSGYNNANEILFDNSGFQYVTCYMNPARIVKWTKSGDFNLYGAYNEQGTRDGAINVTAYIGNGTETFELDGEHTLLTQPTVLQFHLGYNETRTYYIKDDSEEIYVFKPSSPYTTYYFTLTDFVGITNGYLETLVNINGTYRVVERWKLDVVNDMPFTLSWGQTYQVKLVCDQGTYIYGDYVAGAVQTYSFVVIEGMFPRTYPGLDLSVKAKRMNVTWIQTNYTDNNEETDWVEITIKYESGYSWSTAYTTNNTGNTQQINWYSADEDTDYVTYVTASRDGDQITWSFSCPTPSDVGNPFEGMLEALGDSWPIEPQYIIGLFMVLAVFGVFSYASMPLGCILGLITAAILNLIGWLSLGWDLLALGFSIGIFAAIAQAKRMEREI